MPLELVHESLDFGFQLLNVYCLLVFRLCYKSSDNLFKHIYGLQSVQMLKVLHRAAPLHLDFLKAKVDLLTVAEIGQVQLEAR